MYGIYSKYYENISLDLFSRDMEEKSGVFVVFERHSGRAVGFSTLKTVDLEIKGRKGIGVFSGDTILEKEYWGSRVLHVKFFLKMVREKMKRPYQPLFWLLISKGYKTYLLMANNFHRYYPDHQGKNEHLAPLVDDYCDKLFPGYFCSNRKLLDFGDGYTFLKSDVAAITETMRADNDKIRFFEQCNPSWQRGTELPCIGQVTFSLLFSYPFALWRKIRDRKSRLPRTSVACE
ncbi:hypothetical protein A11A3_13455 [Alcanivorax hongdengensis A-11-3]|uniref:Uncharacterized protein n=2 Tax=Alcanivorax hongdengensis TaxID=519051 RepID=L0W908_9GAMM|nr:hypothetical protein A11A3_13455 [Alcanivorax hongdengensis A-11-3]